MTCLSHYNPAQNAIYLQKLSALNSLQQSVERMIKNLQLINTGVNAKQLVVSHTTLWQVAADEYDDGTLWTYLADVNNLTNPIIINQTTLLIPNKPTDNLRFGT